MYTVTKSSLPIIPEHHGVNCTYALSSRRKHADHEYNEFIHLSNVHTKDMLTISFKLDRDDPIAYIHWYDSILSGIEDTNFKGFLVTDLLPNNENQDNSNYLQQIEFTKKICTQNETVSQYLNETIYNSISDNNVKSLMQVGLLASENFEILKNYFHPRLNAFYLLDLESKFDFNQENIITFFENLSSLDKIYHYVFREQASSDLKINWIMNALTKNYTLNEQIIHQIQKNWSKINNDPHYLRCMLTNFLYYCKHKKLGCHYST